MEQLTRLIQSFTLRQKLSILLATAIAGVCVFGVFRWQKESDYKPLFTSMAPEDASAVLQKLKETGVDFRLAENGAAVLVPSARVAELRLDMASAGLPKSGRIGFELFDKTNFGATDFTEQINFRRALEGELERSIMSLAEVEHARIHLSFAKDSVFLESRQPAKASVLVRLRPGARLSPQNVLAVTHLVASAVEGLQPQAVSVLDMRGNLLNRGRRPANADTQEASDELFEYQQRVERDLLAKINTTLEPLLGAEKYRTGVSVECDTTSGEQSEETFDPNKSVMVSQQTTEDRAGTPSAAAGIPGTASSLPNPPSKPPGSNNATSRRTDNTTYQTSRLVRHIKMPQGAVKRISVSVLVDHSIHFEGQGPKARRILTPPTPEALKTIREVVAGVAGLNTDRGDRLIVETMPFESTLSQEPEPEAQKPANPAPSNLPLTVLNQQLQKYPLLLPIAGGALVVVLLVAGLLWRSSRKKRAAILAQARTAVSQPVEESPALASGESAAPAGQVAAGQHPALLPSKIETLTNEVRAAARKDAEPYVAQLRTWLSQEQA